MAQVSTIMKISHKKLAVRKRRKVNLAVAKLLMESHAEKMWIFRRKRYIMELESSRTGLENGSSVMF